MSADPSNPPVVGIRRSRIACDITRGTQFGLTEYNTGREPRVAESNAWTLDLLFTAIPKPGQRPVVADLSDVTSLTLVAKPSQTTTTPVIALQTVNAAQITDLPTQEAWGAATAQHVRFSLTGAQMAVFATSGATSARYWIAVTALVDGEERTLAAGNIVVEADNNAIIGDPPAADAPTILATQWFNGSGAPASDLGRVGDYYLDNDAPKNYYEKTDATTWTLLGQLSGSGGSGSGDVVGPAEAVADNFAAFDGTTGKLIKDSGKKASDFADAEHSHAAADVTSGTFPVARGGTGLSSLTSTVNRYYRTPGAPGDPMMLRSFAQVREDIGAATAAQGALADSAQQPPAEGPFVDGDKTKLDGIESGANNYTLPAPTTTVIGGVKRNTGSAGQFVAGISETGDLEYDSPSGSGDVVGPASATDGAAAIFDGATGKLLKDGVVLGGAAQLDVGTTAGTVAAGDDSRLSDERVPTAAGLTDKFSAAKGSLADDDRVAIFDSAASNAPKHSLWSVVKATLKTYFDTLYVALTGAQTIAGVKTFSDSPIVPEPTTDTQAANKKYVDDNAGGNGNLTVITESGTAIALNAANAYPNYIRATNAGDITATIAAADVGTAGLHWIIRQAAAGVVTLAATDSNTDPVTRNGDPSTAGQHTEIAVILAAASTVDIVGGAA